jgi:dipeptidyl aminopeptidase/acylaminoacyl peptidase
LIVTLHGGPTACAIPGFTRERAYWTSRGFAVLDVNYAGSTGFGRAYRQRLEGQWGVAEVDDVVAAVRHLAAAGEIDPARALIRGGSAGGFTTLAALTASDVFAAGCSLFGVSDLGALARDTHKLESRYLWRLVAPWPEGEKVYAARSPLNRLDRLRTPLILLQGTEDRVVPPAQAELMADALRAQGLPVAVVMFEGEGHGFRDPANLVRALEAELSFYAQVLGLPHPEGVDRVEVENL